MHHKNKSLEDIDGEIWIDALGYDGIYSVSNMGRVRSEQRYVPNGAGTERLVKQRILSQMQDSYGRLSVNLSVNNIKKPTPLNQLIYYSFYPNELNDAENKEVAHLNKIQNDNRLCNLKKYTPKGGSYKISMDLGNCKHLDKMRRELHPYTKQTGVFKDSKLVARTCKLCKETKDVVHFENFRNTCKECRNKEKRKTYKKRIETKQQGD